ncbi:MAG: putative low-complexity protein [Akkermansiaceae bacterium]|jgi:uncharacterized low-complexity protein
MKLTKTLLFSALTGLAFFAASCSDETKENLPDAAADKAAADKAAADKAAADKAAADKAAADKAAADKAAADKAAADKLKEAAGTTGE